MKNLHFFVPGIPAPGGSKRFVGHAKSSGRAILVDDAGQRNKDWRAAVALAAKLRMQELGLNETFPRGVALQFSATFVMPRPKGHFRTGKRAGELRDTAPYLHTKKPDVLKLGRSTEDALTGIVYADDSVIAREVLTKRYAAPTEGTGATISIQVLEP